MSGAPLSSEKRQQPELHLLRILATLAVLVMHLDKNRALVPASPVGEALFHAIWAAATWCVPCFVMISGRFFLDPARPLPLRRLFGKSIRRVVLAFAFWSAVYVAMQVFWQGRSYSAAELLREWLIGPYHFWYLYMIAGLYLVTPLLRPIAADRRLSGYFLLLFLAFAFLREYTATLPHIGYIASYIAEYSHVHLVVGYSGYYLLGLYLQEAAFSPRQEKLLYALGLLCFLFTCFAGSLLPHPEGFDLMYFQLYMKLNVIIESAALYTFFVRRVSRLRFSARAEKLLAGVSALCFGIYLIHPAVMELLAWRGWSLAGRNAFLSVPLLTGTVFLLCAAAVWLMRKIPGFGRFFL